MSSLFTAIVFKFHMPVPNLNKKIICIKQNDRLLSEEFSEHPRDAEIKSIYNVFITTSLWLLFAIGAHVTSVPYLIHLWYYNFQAILACSEKSSENFSESNQAFCLMQIIFFQIFGKFFGKQSSVLFNANNFFPKLVHSMPNFITL